MSAGKTKKARKLRGSRTHGWGSPKKHRGAGSRGGRGNAGHGKKGQQKMSFVNKITKKYIGRHGFVRPGQSTEYKTLNLSSIETNLDSYLNDKIAVKKGSVVSIDVSKLGVKKVLGGGVVHSKLEITAHSFSEGAKEKIEKAGGKAISTKQTREDPVVAEDKKVEK